MHPTHLPQVWETHKHFRKTQKCCCFFFCFLRWLPVRLHAFQHISTPTGGDLNYSSLLSQHLSQSGKLVGALGWPAIFQGWPPSSGAPGRHFVASCSSLLSVSMQIQYVKLILLLSHNNLRVSGVKPTKCASNSIQCLKQARLAG